MTIGINATAAFSEPRTGVEKYVYQLIKHLAMLPEAAEHRFLLYAPFDKFGANPFGDFLLPDNFRFEKLKWNLPMWTQIRLSWEMAWRNPEVLFVPVHVLPLIHPKNSVVTIHGLEYEYFPEMYPKRRLAYLRWSARYALKNARKIIAISENTKKDLVGLYGGNPEKIFVVHHGADDAVPAPVLSLSRSPLSFPRKRESSEYRNLLDSRFRGNDKRSGNDRKGDNPYILYIGRIETKKNTQGLIDAFQLLKRKYNIPHRLILAGGKGWDFRKIKIGPEVILTGYISEEEKWRLLKGADCFVFPSHYEGFGLPILEAQQAGCPVVVANNSCLPEVAGEGAIVTNDFAEGVYRIISDKKFRSDIIQKGLENVKKFSWQKCAEETLKVIYESRAGS